MNESFDARHVIEALRSGVPSRKVGQYFSSSRPEIMSEINKAIDKTCDNNQSGGMVVAGKYGEGKTHLLNTVMDIAHNNNMVVSVVSLSKETPFDKLHLVYSKLMAGTYLPGHLQPGISQLFESLTSSSPVAIEMQKYSETNLECDKLYYLLRSYLGTEDTDEKFLLLADLEGDFIANNQLKQIYKRIYSKKVVYSRNFGKTKNMQDYFAFFSHLFLQLGYNGWVVLFDETELIGRLSKNARLKSYDNMGFFLGLKEHSQLESVFSMFALGSSYSEDVIESKHEFDNLSNALLDGQSRENVEKVIQRIIEAPQLLPLTKEENCEVVKSILKLHGLAYNWNPPQDVDAILSVAQSKGYLLRTKIRAVIEQLDQLYQYGQVCDIKINDLGQITFDSVEPLDDLIG